MSSRLANLEKLVDRLRGPDGCPWDREQTLGDLRAYLLEEAHETAAAIDSGDRDALEGELGDLVFLVVFVAALAREEGAFDLDTVLDRVHRKMVERHPHVFTSEKLPDADAVRGSWEKRKLSQNSGSHLEGVPPSLPALLCSYRMTQKAAGVGFDWSAPEHVLDKIDEEVAELREALDSSTQLNSDEVAEEIGDLLFTMANLARKLKLDPEAALAGANLKFKRRFEYIETSLRAQGRALDEADLGELEALWQKAKENGEG
ncbi:MAG: nucleoside triphosphate pyrophosphohydrolase [Acidobacteriota bacterium]|nr:nucleoside triphosphate pyrophosphohydrolase [Acidobacteriota bacterium]